MYTRLHVILVGFYLNLNFVDRFKKKKVKYKISRKSVQWEPVCRRTYKPRHDEVIVTFRVL